MHKVKFDFAIPRVSIYAILIAILKLVFILKPINLLIANLVTSVGIVLALLSNNKKVFIFVTTLIFIASPIQVLSRYGFSPIGYDEGRFWGFASLIEKYGRYDYSFAIYENPYYQLFGVVSYIDYLYKEITRLNMETGNTILVIILNITILMLFYMIIRRLKLEMLGTSIVLTSLFLQQIAMPILNFIPQSLSYIYLSEILAVLLALSDSKQRMPASSSLLLIMITVVASTITHVTVPLVLIITSIYLLITFFIINTTNKRLRVGKTITHIFLGVYVIALTYWFYSASLSTLIGGGKITILSLLTALKNLLFHEEKAGEAITSSILWLGEMPSASLYTETLLIAATVLSAFKFMKVLMSKQQAQKLDGGSLLVGSLVFAALTFYLFTAFASTRRYYYVAFILSEIALGYLLTEIHQDQERVKFLASNTYLVKKEKVRAILSALVIIGVITAICLLSGTYIADNYMPLPGRTEWDISRQIFYLLDNDTWFYISALGGPSAYTDLRLAVPLTYYGLTDFPNILERRSILIGIKFDDLGERFIDRYFASVYKNMLDAKEYDIVGIWGEYHIIKFDSFSD
ncbi:hypothetical protein ACSU1N_02270 [Thermogladius sp. 4427co]|uniref:hypothetical protein n=1 Tax=Thermogladius sp. 4427co TaxID=3450718 RepID=UPI003F79CC3C